MTEYVRKDNPDGARFTLVPEGFNLKTVPGYVAMYPSGGGMNFFVPEDEFKTLFEPAPPRKWRKGYFCLADGPLQVPGWTNGRLWNGWAVPYFERHVAEMLALELTCDEFKFHWEGDNLICTDFNYPDEPYGFLPETIEGKQLWQVGDGWCWDEVTE